MSLSISESLIWAGIMFLFTISFAYAYKLFKKFKISSYFKCFAAGVILSTMIFDIIKDLYEVENKLIGQLAAGISFLILFWIDKMYLSRSGEHDSIPADATLKKAVIFVVALSIHSFLEGLGFAGKEESRSRFFYLVGLFGHKWIEAFVLGVSILTAPFSQSNAFYLIFLYSFLTPLGMVLGAIIISVSKKMFVEGNWIKNICLGLSTGSFFYIGFVEMMNSEFEHDHSKKNDDPASIKKENIILRNKLACITLGFSIMSALFFLLDSKEIHNA